MGRLLMVMGLENGGTEFGYQNFCRKIFVFLIVSCLDYGQGNWFSNLKTLLIFILVHLLCASLYLCVLRTRSVPRLFPAEHKMDSNRKIPSISIPPISTLSGSKREFM